MGSLNRAQLIGYLGRDPEVRYMANGDAVATCSIATSESWKDKDSGEKQEKTEWHRLTMFRKLGEIAGEYLKKGSQIYVEGKITTRKWQDKDGNDRYTTEIVCDRLVMLGSSSGGRANEPPPQGEKHAPTEQRKPPPSEGNKMGGVMDLEDDIPF